VTEEQWAKLAECVGEVITGELKNLIKALRMMPSEAEALGLGEESDIIEVMEALQRSCDSDARVWAQYYEIVESLSEALGHAIANRIITGDERPLASGAGREA